MDCRQTQQSLGPYLDGELPPERIADVRAHLASCPGCASELQEWQRVLGGLGEADPARQATAPPQLWSAIEQHLAEAADRRRRPMLTRVLWRPLAAAASIAALIGAGVFVGTWLSPAVQTAQATTVDYAVLLDLLPGDVDAAVRAFLAQYHAEPVDAAALASTGTPLHFNLPAELPGGFHLEGAYRLQFGASPGFAGRYRRGSEPLFVFFHPPVGQTLMGVHRQSHCAVAGAGGKCVQVGGWQLIHFTDATTCHCLLSHIEKEQDLRAVLAAISPDYPRNTQPN